MLLVCIGEIWMMLFIFSIWFFLRYNVMFCVFLGL